MHLQQAILKVVNKPESKLEKASFTGSCYTLGNPKAAEANVKKHYQKSLSAWTLYWQGMLLTAWHKLIAEFPILQEKLSQAKEAGKEEFIRVLRLVNGGNTDFLISQISNLTKSLNHFF